MRELYYTGVALAEIIGSAGNVIQLAFRERSGIYDIPLVTVSHRAGCGPLPVLVLVARTMSPGLRLAMGAAIGAVELSSSDMPQ